MQFPLSEVSLFFECFGFLWPDLEQTVVDGLGLLWRGFRRINVAWQRYWFAFIRADFADLVNSVERHHDNRNNPPYLLQSHDLADVL